MKTLAFVAAVLASSGCAMAPQGQREIQADLRPHRWRDHGPAPEPARGTVFLLLVPGKFTRHPGD